MKTKKLTVVIPEDLHAKMKKAVEKEFYVSEAELIRDAIKRRIKEIEKEHGSL